MKSIFDKVTREEIIARMAFLDNNSKAKWGKMNVFQMLLHCTLWDDMMQGKINVKRMWIGRIIGPLMLKRVLKDDRPLDMNTPTTPLLAIKLTTGNIDVQRKEWMDRLAAYEHFNNDNFNHTFFGRMTKEQVGQLVYKHEDHHLRQFGC